MVGRRALIVLGPLLVASATTLGAASVRFPILLTPGTPPPETSAVGATVGGESVVITGMAPRTGPVVVWIDTPLVGPRGLEEAVRALSAQAERLLALGEVDLVLADPDPTPLVRGARDPEVLTEALRQAGQDAVAVGELAWLRRRFLAASELATPEPGQARRAATRESDLIHGQRSALARWLASEGYPDGGALLLISHGFDLEPRRFYLELAGETVAERSPPDPEQAGLARALAAAGWTTVALAMGRRQPELEDPRAALVELTAATAGEIVGRPRDLGQAIDRLGRRWLVRGETDAATGAGSEPETLEVTLSDRAVRAVEAPRWAGTGDVVGLLARLEVGRPSDGSGSGATARASSRPVLRLLPPDAGLVAGRQSFETITGRRRIGRVVFLLDGRPASEDGAAPFTAEIDLGTEPATRTLTAVAYSRSGRRLGSDSLVLNPELDTFEVLLSELSAAGDGGLEVLAEIRPPRGRSVERVEFFWGDRRLDGPVAPPYRVAFGPNEATEDDYVRVVAHLDDGTFLEDARLRAPARTADRIDVQLVELLAVVTRRGGGVGELGPEDFTVVQGGETQKIRQFAAAGELPLTLGLAVDTSESMKSWMSGAREAAARFLTRALGEEDRAFLVHFDTSPRLAHEPSEVDQVVQRLGGLRPRGDTVLFDGLLFSLLQFDRLTGGRRALVILTDGRDEGSRFGPRDCLRAASERGVPVYFIALGAPPNPLVEPRPLGLVQLARQTGGRLFYLSSPEDLDPIYDRIQAELEGQYYLAYSTDRELSPAELRELEVRVRGDGLEVRAIPSRRLPGG